MSNIDKRYSESLRFSDVFIIPRYSNISTRKQVDISSNLGFAKVPVPVITANMESVTGTEMCSAVRTAGALGALHRFGSIEEAVEEFKEVTLGDVSLEVPEKERLPVLVSIGVNRDSEKRFKALYKAGARHFIIDIAHGHSEQMKTMIRFCKSFADTYVIAGNVGTYEGAYDLCTWGADAIKAGLAEGMACATKNVTGVLIPQITCIHMVKQGIKRYLDECVFTQKSRKMSIALISDGGIREIGDICKAIGAGADFVMCGSLFAGCDEAPNKGIYRGSASAEVQTKYRTDKDSMPTPEGFSLKIDSTGPVSQLVEHIAGGLQSSFSYVGSRTKAEFQQNCHFGIKLH